MRLRRVDGRIGGLFRSRPLCNGLDFAKGNGMEQDVRKTPKVLIRPQVLTRIAVEPRTWSQAVRPPSGTTSGGGSTIEAGSVSVLWLGLKPAMFWSFGIEISPSVLSESEADVESFSFMVCVRRPLF